MGCRASHQGDEEGKPPSDVPARDGPSPLAFGSSASPISIGSSGRAILGTPASFVKRDRAIDHDQILADGVCKAAAITGASRAQLDFLDAWIHAVFKPIIESGIDCSQRLLIAADLQSLEVGVTGTTAELQSRAKLFLSECQMRDTSMLDHMDQVVEETTGHMDVRLLTLWCRLKRIGSSSPAADAGFSLNGSFEWALADVLMPAVRDQELLREHAEHEFMSPCTYSCSLFPTAPERTLEMEMAGAPRKALISALFFFKALGFTKPEDATVRLLGITPASQYGICATMGPKGLTRIALRMLGLRRAVAEDLATCAGCKYEAEKLQHIADILNLKEADIVEYAAEARGYTVAVGFC